MDMACDPRGEYIEWGMVEKMDNHQWFVDSFSPSRAIFVEFLEHLFLSPDANEGTLRQAA